MPLIYPTLPGLAFSVQKTPTWSTKTTTAASGRETRVALWQYPIWNFQLVYEFLRDAAAYNELKQLMGFYLQCQGAFGTFLFVDPDDCQATGQAIGVGDGATIAFTMIRSLGGFIEPVGGVTALSAVYLNGTPQAPASYSVSGATLTFTTAPPAGAVITADFQFAFLCRFKDDTLTFEKFMAQLWQVQQLNLISVRA